ncbi:ABC transporter permease [Bacillus sp. B15-48]|uniref:C1q-like domain-containing protein n=1 Tax=Bacillus sp. B15-48 TaxID=1548601 RepID=UPI00193EF4D1|nr:ABC transporter permease [Bacillus sp. B15-48]MBM4765363.1 ABC transporter permease [Bacillus sp. B15-48]
MGIRRQKIKSAFRALSNEFQSVQPGEFIAPVQYGAEQFDLRGEYNTDTSIFTPANNGVYSVIASINFEPNLDQQHAAVIAIRVNGEAVASNIKEYSAIVPGFSNILTVSVILSLQAGDEVDVSFSTLSNNEGVGGVITPSIATSFQAARFPSPATGLM